MPEAPKLSSSAQSAETGARYTADSLSIPSHYGLGNPAEKVKRLYEQAWVEDTKETSPTKHSSIGAHMKSQRLWLYTQDLYGSAQIWFLC